MRPVYVDRTIHCRHLGSSLCNLLLPHSIFLRRARLWAAQVSGLVMSAVSVIAPPKSLSISLFAAIRRFFLSLCRCWAIFYSLRKEQNHEAVY